MDMTGFTEQTRVLWSSFVLPEGMDGLLAKGMFPCYDTLT